MRKIQTAGEIREQSLRTLALAWLADIDRREELEELHARAIEDANESHDALMRALVSLPDEHQGVLAVNHNGRRVAVWKDFRPGGAGGMAERFCAHATLVEV